MGDEDAVQGQVVPAVQPLPDVLEQHRGNYDKVLLQYVRERLDGRDDLALDRIFVTHTPCRPETVEAVKAEIQTYAPFSEIIETTAGCTKMCIRDRLRPCGPEWS